jgi:hypothetical protein
MKKMILINAAHVDTISSQIAFDSSSVEVLRSLHHVLLVGGMSSGATDLNVLGRATSCRACAAVSGAISVSFDAFNKFPGL